MVEEELVDEFALVAVERRALDQELQFENGPADEPALGPGPAGELALGHHSGEDRRHLRWSDLAVPECTGLLG